MSVFDELAAEFPRSAVSWRAQSVKKDGSSALALAYIDARDVMNRLDGVLGPANWKDRYEFNGTTAICYLSIRVDGEWVEKADGAGATDVEAEKGQLSDAFKRSAVKWQIGRYLYDVPAPWVPCKSYESDWNGKKKWVWQSWTGDPWNFVKGLRPEPAPPSQATAEAPQPPKTGFTYNEYSEALTEAMDVPHLQNIFKMIWRDPGMSDGEKDNLKGMYERRKVALAPKSDAQGYVAPSFDNLPHPIDAEQDELQQSLQGLK